jgi:hypothetical protein
VRSDGLRLEPGTQLSALDAFLGMSASLLKGWRRAGKHATRWWYENPTDVSEMHRAQETLRRRYILDWRFASSTRTSMPWEIGALPEQAQPCLDYDYVRPALLGAVYLMDSGRSAMRDVPLVFVSGVNISLGQ